MDFAPPPGQRCETCLSADCKLGRCHRHVPWFPKGRKPRDILTAHPTASVGWCGSWKPNRDLTCEMCDLHPLGPGDAGSGCPRVFMGTRKQLALYGIPAPQARACACWEHEEKL